MAKSGHGNPKPVSAELVATPKERALKDVKITNVKWSKEGFGNVLEASFTIENNSLYDVKDVEVKCIQHGPSGTAIGSNNRTVYEKIKAGEKKDISAVNMGFIDTQSSKASFQITDLEVIKPDPEKP